MPRPTGQPYDWQRFWIHFVFGGLLGSLIGFFFWLRNWYPGLSVCHCMVIPALTLALLGGIYGDRFWERLLSFIGRLGWWV